MENNALFEKVRHMLRDDDVSAALQLLIDQLKTNAANAEVVRTLRVIDASVASTKQRERKGILGYNEALPIYSQAIDSIHGIIEDLEQGRVPQRQHSDTAPAPTTSSSSRKALVALFSVAVLVLAGWYLFKKTNKNPGITQLPATTDQKAVCPEYTSEGVRVLILPFHAFGSETEKPELGIQRRIRTLTTKNNLPSMVEVYSGTLQNNNVPDENKAAEFGRTCGADLVIWGLYDKRRDETKVDVSYVFTQTRRTGKSDFQSVSGLPALVSGNMFRDMDDAVLSICTVLAIRDRNKTLALKWLDQIKKPNADEVKMRQLLATNDNPRVREVKPELSRKTLPLKKVE